MDGILSRLFDRIEPIWHRPSGLAYAIITSSTIVTLFLTKTFPGSHFIWAVIPVSSLLVLTFWGFSNRCPRSPKGTIGIAIAISCEEKSQQKRIEADLFLSLKELLQESNSMSRFNVILLPKHISDRIPEPGMAHRYMRKSRSQFILHCRGRQREIQGSLRHVLNFQSIVGHSIVDTNIQDDLRNDMRQFIPKRAILSLDGDIFAFEIASDLINIATRYIIATSALISGYVAFAESLFIDLQRRLPPRVTGPLANLSQKIQQRLTILYHNWIIAISDEHRMTRNDDLLNIADVVSSKLLVLSPNHYNGLLTAAICDFTLRRDIDHAIRLLEKSRRSSDATWRYSLAFLYAYIGDEKKCLQHYDRAFKGEVSNISVPVQSEEFINLLLIDEPEQTQLHFCLGLINYCAKGDIEMARSELNIFTSSTDPIRLPVFYARANEILRAIEEEPRT
ncbi:MAG: hypothetical protein Q8L64_01365 [bacterium]|nr:hypothetical protein [bacterium]